MQLMYIYIYYHIILYYIIYIYTASPGKSDAALQQLDRGKKIIHTGSHRRWQNLSGETVDIYIYIFIYKLYHGIDIHWLSTIDILLSPPLYGYLW